MSTKRFQRFSGDLKIRNASDFMIFNAHGLTEIIVFLKYDNPENLEENSHKVISEEEALRLFKKEFPNLDIKI